MLDRELRIIACRDAPVRPNHVISRELVCLLETGEQCPSSDRQNHGMICTTLEALIAYESVWADRKLAASNVEQVPSSPSCTPGC